MAAFGMFMCLSAFAGYARGQGVVSFPQGLEPPPPIRKAVLVTEQPAIQVPLNPLLNRHWKTTESFKDGKDTTFVGIQFDRSEMPHISVKTDDWEKPKFYSLRPLILGKPFDPRWTLNGKTYELSIPGAPDIDYGRMVNINRRVPTKMTVGWVSVPNPIDDSISALNPISIHDLLVSAYNAGQSVIMGGREYKLFYYNEIEDFNQFGLTFVYHNFDCKQNGLKEYIVYIVPREDILDKKITYSFFDNKRMNLRVVSENKAPILEISEVKEKR